MLIVTTSDRAKEVVKNVIKEKMWSVWVSGIVIVDKDMIGHQFFDIPVVANADNMYEYATRSVVDKVFIHLPYRIDQNMQDIVERFEDMGIEVDLNINPELFMIIRPTVLRTA
jgi:FlaA1/EpsC-like NDP-sugar epimerase